MGPQRWSPDLGFDVALGLHQHVNDRAIVDVLGEDLLGDAALEELAPFLDVAFHHVEEKSFVSRRYSYVSKILLMKK